jgi:hypothetical protein
MVTPDLWGAPRTELVLFFIELVAEADRDLGGRAIMAMIRERTDYLAGIKVEVQPLEKGPPVGKPIQIEFSSNQRGLLEPAMAQLRAHLDTLPELVDIDDSAALPSIEWRIEVDRQQAALYGADVSSAGLAVQLITNGVKVGEYRPDDAEDSVDIRVRFPKQDRGITAMDELRISTDQGMVPLSNFVRMQPAPGVDALKRIDGRPVELIRANVRDGIMADGVVADIDAWLAKPVFRSGDRYPISRCQRGAGGLHGLCLSRFCASARYYVLVVGISVQQFLSERADSVGGGDVYGRSAIGLTASPESVQCVTDRGGCRRIGRDRGKQQYYSHRYLQSRAS